MVHKIRNLTAVESVKNLAGINPKLAVACDVETTNQSEMPKLTEASPQGLNPKVLILDLTIETSGVGGDVMGWKAATFATAVSEGQYTDVSVVQAGSEDHAKVTRLIS